MIRPENSELMGIIQGGQFGMRDASSPVLWFAVYTDADQASLQVLGLTEACELLKRHNVYDVADLDGRPCVVRVKGSAVTFLDLLDIPRWHARAASYPRAT